jgi:hypothetical protein
MANRKDLIGGLLVIAVGGAFCIEALLHLRMGTALRMGPGYFPFIVGLVVVAFGVLITLGAFREPDVPLGPVPWRAILMISLAPVIFGLTVRGAGLAPSMAASVFVSAFASRRMGIPLALAVAAALTLFCVLVFQIALGLPLRPIGPWLGG